MITALLATGLGILVGAALGFVLSHQFQDQRTGQWMVIGAGVGAAGFWLLQALFKFVLRSLCWISLGGLVGAGLGFAVLRLWPDCPVAALPQWLALAFAAVFLLHTWTKTG